MGKGPRASQRMTSGPSARTSALQGFIRRTLRSFAPPGLAQSLARRLQRLQHLQHLQVTVVLRTVMTAAQANAALPKTTSATRRTPSGRLASRSALQERTPRTRLHSAPRGLAIFSRGSCGNEQAIFGAFGNLGVGG